MKIQWPALFHRAAINTFGEATTQSCCRTLCNSDVNRKKLNCWKSRGARAPVPRSRCCSVLYGINEVTLHYRCLVSSTGMCGRLWTGKPLQYVTSHPGQLSLLPSVGREVSTSQSVVILCILEVKAGMAHYILRE